MTALTVLSAVMAVASFALVPFVARAIRCEDSGGQRWDQGSGGGTGRSRRFSGIPVVAYSPVVDIQRLNEKRWRIAVALMATGFVLAAVVGLRAAWLLATLGALMLVIESLRRLGLSAGAREG